MQHCPNIFQRLSPHRNPLLPTKIHSSILPNIQLPPLDVSVESSRTSLFFYYESQNAHCFARNKQLAQNATGVSPWDMKRNLRLVFHEKTVGAFCDWCSTVGYEAHFATGVASWDMRRNLRLVSHEKPCGAKCDSCPTLG